ncbi:MAG: hypothetical protein K9K84_03560 [Methylovulum sp.]|nr:hypothetical protein [Methylovulum sp.]
MKLTLFISLIMFVFAVQAADKRVYSTDSMGKRQYNKPSYIITDNKRIYETDLNGKKRYDKQSYRIEGDKIFPTDLMGRRQYDKPAFEVE